MWMEYQATILWVLCLTTVRQATTFSTARLMEELEALFRWAKRRKSTWRMPLRESLTIKSQWETNISISLNSSLAIIMVPLIESSQVRTETRTASLPWELMKSNTTLIFSSRTSIIRSQVRGHEDQLISTSSWEVEWEEHNSKRLLEVEFQSTTTVVLQVIQSSTRVHTISRLRFLAPTQITIQ